MEKGYGEMFRKIRSSQNLTLKEVSKDIVSISYLSKFEKDQTNITLPVFLRLLDRINLKIEEFIYYCGDFEDVFEDFSLVFSDTYKSGDIDGLFKLKLKEDLYFEKTQNKNHKINSIMISAAILDLNTGYLISKEDLNLISDYLVEIPFWSSYNIFVLSNTNAIIPPYLLETLIKEIILQRKENPLSPPGPRQIIFLYHHVCITFLRNNQIEQAVEVHNEAKNLLHSGFFFEKNRSVFIEGLIKISYGDIYNGMRIANEAIEILRFLEPELISKYTFELTRHLEKKR